MTIQAAYTAGLTDWPARPSVSLQMTTGRDEYVTVHQTARLDGRQYTALLFAADVHGHNDESARERRQSHSTKP